MSLTLGSKDHAVLGNFNAMCDVCGFKFKGSELRRRWDGFMVCSQDYEQRHPQDLIRSIPDRQSIPWARPAPPLNFVVVAPVDPNSL